MAEDAQDVQEDPIMASLIDEEQDSPEAESSPAKEEKPEVAEDTKEEVQGDDTPTAPDVPTKDGEEAKEEESTEAEEPTEDKPLGKAEERKLKLNTEIRDLVSKRNELKSEVEKANAEVYQPATEDELVEDGYSETDAKVEALRQEIEMRNYNDKVTEAQLTLNSESERVIQDFPIFDDNSPDYDEDLAVQTGELLEANLIRDPNTKQVIGSNISPYKLYKTIASAAAASTAKGQLKGQKDTENMLANADSPASVAPPAKPKDPLMDLLIADD